MFIQEKKNDISDLRENYKQCRILAEEICITWKSASQYI